MNEVLGLVLPFFGLIALGFLCGRLKNLPEEGMAWMSFFLIYVALPALFFRILAKTPLEQLNNLPYIIGTTLSTYSIFSLGFAYIMIVTRGNMPQSTIGGIAAAYGNIGYMGPGLALAAIGPEATVPVALIFCFDNALHFSLAPFFMTLGGGKQASFAQVTKEVAIKIFTHPFILATFAGVGAAAIKFQPPEALDRLLAFLQGAAAPVALFALGVTVALRYNGMAALGRVALSITPILILKLLVHPVLVFLLLSVLGVNDPVWIYTAVLMASLPPALNVFVIARQYDKWVEQASNVVLMGTVLSVVTLTTALYLIKSKLLPLHF